MNLRKDIEKFHLKIVQKEKSEEEDIQINEIFEKKLSKIHDMNEILIILK